MDKIKSIVKNHSRNITSATYFEENDGTISFSLYTEDRGSRTDHGGGEDGDGWMDDEQISRCAAPYHKKWDPRINEILKEIKKSGYEAEGCMEYGEKGHISLEFYNIRKLISKKIKEVLGNVTIKEMSYGLPGETITPGPKMVIGSKITNRNCGGDPTPGRKKDLYVTFLVDGKEVRRTFSEKETLVFGGKKES